MFEHTTIGRKLALSFTVLVLVLGVIVVASFMGVSGIVDNAEEVIYGNELDAQITQKEVDHLKWVGKVNALLTDESVTTLDVETDDHACGFGTWLYSDARQQAEDKIPGLSAILKGIEEPHQHLHASAHHIAEAFVQADAQLPGILAARSGAGSRLPEGRPGAAQRSGVREVAP